MSDLQHLDEHHERIGGRLVRVDFHDGEWSAATVDTHGPDKNERRAGREEALDAIAAALGVTRVVRATWDEYFMRIALEVSSRATCPRRSVGAVIVRDKTIVATGYNGSVRGMAHCHDAGCMMEEDHCVRTIHAEANALIQAAKNGARVEGATIYINVFPCWSCAKLLFNAGIARIVYSELYRPTLDPRVVGTAAALFVHLVALPGAP